jgi:cyclopropane fatty-acyl-phospholipid synthase-like methyltransferase
MMLQSQVSKKEIFDKYLSYGFADANLSSLEPVLSAIHLDYVDLLPEARDARILDLGCGMGHFLAYLKSRGYSNFIGVEVGAEQVRFCQQHVTENVVLVEETADFLNAHIGEFDCVVFRDVIEHLEKRRVIELLQLVHQSLRTNGFLLVETGNMSSFTGSFLLHKDFTHEVGFTEFSLRQVLRAAGFQDGLIRGNRTPTETNPNGLVRFLLQKLWHRFLRFVFWIERGGAPSPQVWTKLLIAKCAR